jgi:hypothetical protein
MQTAALSLGLAASMCLAIGSCIQISFAWSEVADERDRLPEIEEELRRRDEEDREMFGENRRPGVLNPDDAFAFGAITRMFGLFLSSWRPGHSYSSDPFSLSAQH